MTTGAFTGASQGILLHAGDTYTYQFNTLPFEGHATNGVAAPFGFFSLPLFPSDLGPTGMLRMEMFENTTSETPIFSRTLTSSSSLGDTGATVLGAWGDVQGAIRLTMLSGSVTISLFSLEAVTAGSPSGFDVYGDRVIPRGARTESVGVGGPWLFNRGILPPESQEKSSYLTFAPERSAMFDPFH